MSIKFLTVLLIFFTPEILIACSWKKCSYDAMVFHHSGLHCWTCHLGINVKDFYLKIWESIFRKVLCFYGARNLSFRYRKLECNLFRLPSITTTVLDDEITSKIQEYHWRALAVLLSFTRRSPKEFLGLDVWEETEPNWEMSHMSAKYMMYWAENSGLKWFLYSVTTSEKFPSRSHMTVAHSNQK